MLFLCSLPLFVDASEHGQEPHAYCQLACQPALCAACDAPVSGCPPTCIRGPLATQMGDNLIKAVWTPRLQVPEIFMSTRRYYRSFCTMSITEARIILESSTHVVSCCMLSQTLCYAVVILRLPRVVQTICHDQATNCENL